MYVCLSVCLSDCLTLHTIVSPSPGGAPTLDAHTHMVIENKAENKRIQSQLNFTPRGASDTTSPADPHRPDHDGKPG